MNEPVEQLRMVRFSMPARVMLANREPTVKEVVEWLNKKLEPDYEKVRIVSNEPSFIDGRNV